MFSVQVFSNQPAVELRLNDGAWTRVPVEDHIAAWDVDLARGDNRVEARAQAGGKMLSDAVDWTWATRP